MKRFLPVLSAVMILAPACLYAQVPYERIAGAGAEPGSWLTYLLDRETGEFLVGTPYAKQTWAKGLDPRGRPIVLPNTEPSIEGTLVYPSLQGATNWFSPSYSPLTMLFYVSVQERGATYFKGEAQYVPGRAFMAGGEQPLRGDAVSGAVPRWRWRQAR